MTVTITLSLIIVVVMIVIVVIIVVVIVVGHALCTSIIKLSGRTVAFAMFFKMLDNHDQNQENIAQSLPPAPWQ